MTNKPIRVQRKRTKGYKLPPNTVCVDRTSQWGNPFKVGGLFFHDDTDYEVLTAERAVQFFASAIENKSSALKFTRADLWKLRGKNLACFCSLSSACHADVLLRLANQQGSDDNENRQKGIGDENAPSLSRLSRKTATHADCS
jgi:hypothetical protein